MLACEREARQGQIIAAHVGERPEGRGGSGVVGQRLGASGNACACFCMPVYMLTMQHGPPLAALAPATRNFKIFSWMFIEFLVFSNRIVKGCDCFFLFGIPLSLVSFWDHCGVFFASF